MLSLLSVPMQASAGIGVPWWVWLIILIIAFIIMAMLAPKPQKAIVKAPEMEITLEDEPEDLTRIEGIGPKIQAGMYRNGIRTFSQLAEKDVEALRALLREIDIAADPTTWPVQAGLAAAGSWEALQKLQDELQGGRSV